MNKNLLTLALGLALGTSATMADAPVKKSIPVGNLPILEAAPVSRASTSDGYELRFCDDIYTYYSLSSSISTNYVCYIYITPDVATQLAGNMLDKISLSCCVRSNKNGLNGSVFVSEDIDADPVTSTETKIVNCFTEAGATFQTVELETPYEIKAAQGFYFGFKVERVRTSDYVVGVDNDTPNMFAGTARVESLSGTVQNVVDAARDLSANLSLFANTVGEEKSLTNIGNIASLMLAETTLPMFNTDNGITPQLALTNLGDNTIESIEYTYGYDGNVVGDGTLATSIPSLNTDALRLNIPNVPEGLSNLSINITKINDKEVNLGASAPLIGYKGAGYDRKMVVEEGTSTGCGWCPRGIVGMDYMSKTYPDKFIGIAIHNNMLGSDILTASSYDEISYYYFAQGLPNCVVNRDPYFILDPNQEYLEMVYDLVSPDPSAAKVTIDEAILAEDQSSVEVHTTSSFAFSENNADYRLAFVVVEDGLKAAQANYFAGGGAGAMDGWEKKGSTVAWTYEEVARDIFDARGIEESIPASIEADKKYEFTYNVPLDNIYIGSGTNRMGNVNDTKIVVLLLEPNSGIIINAARLTANQYTPTAGINSVVADSASDAPVEYYNLQGVRMPSDNLPAGIYIMKQGDTAKKVRF